MLPDRVSNSGPLTYESGALPIAPRGPATSARERRSSSGCLTHCLLMDSSTVKCSTSPFVIFGVSSLFCRFIFIFSFFVVFLWKILLAKTVDPDQTPHHVASDLGLHFLPMTR